MALLLVLAMVGLISTRPWRTDNERWFHESALAAAALLGALFISVI